jgi:hypothetical protein
MHHLAGAKSTNDPRAQLLHEAFCVLDKHSAKLGNRDPVKSLNEDANELLQRVRLALDLLMSRAASHDEATGLAERIDAVLGSESVGTQSDR